MIDIIKAIEATKKLVVAAPFPKGITSEGDYFNALELMDYLIENDDENLFVDFLVGKIAEYEDSSERFSNFNKWQKENSEALEALNRFHDEHGCFSDEYRTF